MKKNTLFALWGGLFALCAGLGFIPEPKGFLRVLLTVFAVAAFIPPAVLMKRAVSEKDRRTLSLLRNLSALSLGLTAVLLVGNFLSVFASEAVGDVLYWVLVIVSSPMVCSGYWALSLFLWACLMIAGMSKLKKM